MKRNHLLKILIMLTGGLLLTLNSFAQSISVQGTVKDTTGEPIIGANVVVKGTTNGTITDFDGAFSLSGVKKGDIIVANKNFGCGSSREHAPLVIKTCGTGCVIAKSFARIHIANLINAGILPLTFADPADYDVLDQNSRLTFRDLKAGITAGTVVATDEASGREIVLKGEFTSRQQQILLCGGLLNYTKENS